MKRSSQHAFEPEQIMAYLDGELPANEAAALASHLEHCEECQSIAAQLRQVSERMLEFQVGPCAASIAEMMRRTEEAKTSGPATKEIIAPRSRRRVRRILAWAGGAAALVLLAWLSIPNRLTVNRSVAEVAAERASGLAARDETQIAQLQSYAKLLQPKPGLTLPAPEGPMIEQTASITILASNYDQASKAVEQITTQHGGYVQDMNANTETGVARSFSATLRVPEKQLDSFLSSLGRLGHVDQESRSNQEITDQYIDLTARLRNARAEQQRILEILKTRTGKLSDVLQTERELARVGGDIESMEGQRTYMEHEVSYATVQVQLNELYRAQLNPGAVSTGTRIRNSLIEGFRNLSDDAVSLVIFAFSYGPSILLWLALIGLPAWFCWRRFRRSRNGVSMPRA
jgi:hypothetical protein